MKPDILAPGYALDSALSFSTNCKAEEDSYLKAGTSMAAPVIAGVGALVREYFQEGWYPCGSRYCGATLDPSGSLVKATIANGGQYTKGVQQGGTENIIKTQPVRPYDNNQGMGETNLLTTLPLTNENDFNMFVENDVKLTYGESKAYVLNINKAGCSSDLSATIAWYDQVGSNGCQRCLVNDIDLLVEKISPDAVKYYPNGKGSRDDMNTIERVRINTSPGDKYKITVKARMLGPQSNEQAFSLAVTGCFTRVNEEDQSVVTKQEVQEVQRYELPITYSANRKQAGKFANHSFPVDTYISLTFHLSIVGNMFGIRAKVEGVEINSFAFQTLISGRTTAVHVYKLVQLGNVYGNEAFLNNPAGRCGCDLRTAKQFTYVRMPKPATPQLGPGSRRPGESRFRRRGLETPRSSHLEASHLYPFRKGAFNPFTSHLSKKRRCCTRQSTKRTRRALFTRVIATFRS